MGLVVPIRASLGLDFSVFSKFQFILKLFKARRTLSLDLCPPASPPYEGREVEMPRPLMLIPL